MVFVSADELINSTDSTGYIAIATYTHPLSRRKDDALLANQIRQRIDPMEQLFVFTAYNSQAMYGWGDAVEAERYCDHLNRNRAINVYGFGEITDADEIARHDNGNEGVNLSDELIAIRFENGE